MSDPEGRTSAARNGGGQQAEGAARRAPCPVVGIGGSAGGVEAFRHFLAAVAPDCGMAFVIIQHLSPHQESRLTEVLRSAARIEVVEIADDTPVEPNHVYVTPENAVDHDPRRRVAGRLAGRRGGAPRADRPVPAVARRGPGRERRLRHRLRRRPRRDAGPARDQGAWRARLVQSAARPRRTTACCAARSRPGWSTSSCAVEEMPRQARRYFDHVDDVQRKKRRDGLAARSTPHDLQRICRSLQARTGHDFNGYKESTLIRRIQRRMQVLQIDELSGTTPSTWQAASRRPTCCSRIS